MVDSSVDSDSDTMFGSMFDLQFAGVSDDCCEYFELANEGYRPGHMFTILFECAARGDLNKLNLDLEIMLNLDFNLIDSKGCTMLHYAVMHNQYWNVDFLLNQDVNINIKDMCGNTAVHYAIIHDADERILKELIAHNASEYGANLNVLNKHQTSPLAMAIIKKRKNLAKLLIKHGAKSRLHKNQKLDKAALSASIQNITDSVAQHKQYYWISDKLLKFRRNIGVSFSNFKMFFRRIFTIKRQSQPSTSSRSRHTSTASITGFYANSYESKKNFY